MYTDDQPPKAESLLESASGGGFRGHLEEVAADVRHQFQLAAQGDDVAGEGLDGGDLAVLDLGDPARSDAHDLREPGLCEAQALALLGKLAAPLFGRPA